MNLVRVTPRDRELLEKYNATEEPIPEQTLHGVFERMAVERPENAAVIFGDESLSYGELDTRSNQVARYLREQGVGRGSLVGVLAHRCIETIVNVMGILKAGAGYIPLNPEHPEDRRGYILENAGAKMQLVPSSYVEEDLDRFGKQPLGEPGSPDDVAYVIYTSGSTGRPKGVVIKHKAAANTIVDINNKYRVNEDDRIIGLSSMCFDLSVYDVFGALFSGAALVIIADQRDVKNVRQVLKQQGVTIWNSVPAIMDMMLDAMEEPGGPDRLRLVLLSGDWIPLSLPDKIRSQFEGAQVISLGGATEASIWSIYYPIETVKAEWKSIPYGMPLANQKFYVLNYEKRECPVGVAGELYLGGAGLAEGYLNDEEKTQAAFIDHEVLGRLYRTGDYGVMHRQGYIEFQGRKDQQVKIRGYRVELGEIETRLLEYPGVRGAVVIDRTDHGRKSLCAYVIAEGELEKAALRDHLGNLLPDYMVPSYFVMVDEIPLTANGKVDRKGLPEPEGGAESGAQYHAPTTELESQLAAIWQGLLGIEKIGIDDNFFELGGNSVLMVRGCQHLCVNFISE